MNFEIVIGHIINYSKANKSLAFTNDDAVFNIIRDAHDNDYSDFVSADLRKIAPFEVDRIIKEIDNVEDLMQQVLIFAYNAKLTADSDNYFVRLMVISGLLYHIEGELNALYN